MADRPKRSSWIWPVAVLGIGAIAAAMIALIAGGGPRESLGPLRGLRLGISPSQARDMLHTGARGSFRTTTAGEDFSLTWTPSSDRPELRRATLEFHDGLLVAVRLLVAPSAPEAEGPALEHTEISVLTREPAQAGVELTWIARSCPTHADEVRRRMTEHR